MGRKQQKRDVNAESAAGFSSSFGDLLKGAGFDTAPSEEQSADTSTTEAASTTPDIAYDLSRCGGLVLRKERKGRGGKTVTRLTGRGDADVGLSAPDLKALAKDLRKALGCGASIENGELVLQGDIAPRAAEWLTAHGAVVSH
ncbi:MAG: hypothetical protein ACE366_14490 [Bradymonadia bacterium]